MAAALVAFGGAETYELVHTMLNKTDSGCAGCHVIDDGIMPVEIDLWFSPRICSRTLIGGRSTPSVFSRGAAACYLLVMLTRAVSMTSSHSKAVPDILGDVCQRLVPCLRRHFQILAARASDNSVPASTD